MGVRVTKRRNADGSITKRTTVTRKTMFGNTKSQTFVERKPAKKGGCYVATCVYGSYDCPQVWTLRRYRDQRLAQTAWGRVFISCYYAVSPTIVRIFGENRFFQSFWKTRLDHMVQKLNAKGISSSQYQDEF